MDIQIKKGLLEVCVLAMLNKEDSYGYKMIGDLSACVDISESTLYPILKRLEASACLETYSSEHNGRLRKYYRITETGRRRIAAFTEEWEEVMRLYRFIIGGGNTE